MNRVARRAVVVSDLRRSWFAAIGFWLASFVFRFHRVTRHDGVVSVMPRIHGAGVARPRSLGHQRDAGRIAARLGFRLTARWSPDATPMSAPHDLGPMPADRGMTTIDERSCTRRCRSSSSWRPTSSAGRCIFRTTASCGSRTSDATAAVSSRCRPIGRSARSTGQRAGRRSWR